MFLLFGTGPIALYNFDRILNYHSGFSEIQKVDDVLGGIVCVGCWV